MTRVTRRSLASSLFILPMAWASHVLGQTPTAQAPAQTPPADDLTSIDSDGTAHIKRSIPVPKTISPDAYALLVSGKRWTPEPGTKQAEDFDEKLKATYPVEITESILAGVECKVVIPKRAAQKHDRVLICLHGGGFTSDSGSTLEGTTIAALTGIKVIAVEYRLAPQYPFPAAVDDAVAVYKYLLKQYAPRKIGVYGTSAGAVLTAQMAVESRRLSLPLPAVLGFFSGYVDLARYGDSRFLYGTNGFTNFSSMLPALKGLGMVPYVGGHDRHDPVLSPMYADLNGFPPTLCMTSTRDHCLSGTVDFHRGLLRAGVDTHLMVFDALPHSFWYLFDLPESREALEAQANFLDRHLA
jgi:monoterpene epsilon-lactone hydrolase